MTVPNSMVTKDQVYKIKAKGCKSIKIPSVMKQQAASSMGPRRSHRGQRPAEADGRRHDHGRALSSLINVPRTVMPGFAAATLTFSGGISDCGRA